MAINFGREYKQFRKEMKKRHELYEQLAMKQEQIDALDAFDKEEFLSNITYMRHAQSFTLSEDSDNSEDMHPLYGKFGDVLTVNINLSLRGRYEWLDEISSASLLKKLLSLSPDDLDILDASVFGEKTQKEIAASKGISQKNISKKLNRIKKFLAE